MGAVVKLVQLISSDLVVNTERDAGVGRFLVGLVHNPGFYTVLLYRISSAVRRYGFVGKLVSVLVWRFSVVTTGCHISPKANIGTALRLPHPIGIVIGSGVIVGSKATIYQGVTIGRIDELSDQYPMVGDSVCVYSSSTVLGGIVVGSGSTVGCNSVVLKSVGRDEVWVGNPARKVKPRDG